MSPEKRERPKRVSGETIEMSTPCGKLYVTLNDEPETGELFEIFLRFGKSGTCASAIANALAVAVSVGLRSGTDPRALVKGLAGISCQRAPAWDEMRSVASCVDAIARAITLHEEGKGRAPPDAQGGEALGEER